MPVTFAEQHRAWHIGVQAVIAKTRGRRRVQSRQPDPMDLVTILASVSWNAKWGVVLEDRSSMACVAV